MLSQSVPADCDVARERDRIQDTEKSCKNICQELKKYQDSIIELSNHESAMVNNLLKAGCSANQLESSLWAWSAVAEQQKVLSVDAAKEYSLMVKQPVKKYNTLFSTWNAAFKNLESVHQSRTKLDQKHTKMRSKSAHDAKTHQLQQQVEQLKMQEDQTKINLHNDAQQFNRQSANVLGPLAQSTALLQLTAATQEAEATKRLCETLNVDMLPATEDAYKQHMSRLFDEIKTLSIVDDAHN